MFIVSLTYKCTIEKVERHLEDHISYLKKEYSDGHFIASGRKVPRTGGIILSKVETRTKLDEILKRDPFHINDVADYEITEFIPTMTSEGFEVLKEI